MWRSSVQLLLFLKETKLFKQRSKPYTGVETRKENIVGRVFIACSKKGYITNIGILHLAFKMSHGIAGNLSELGFLSFFVLLLL